MHVSNYKATFSPMHLVFLELDTHRPHLDFKILNENNSKVITRTLYLQLLNKDEHMMSTYNNETTSKIYPDLNPATPREPQTYRLKKLTEIEAYLLDEIEVRERIAKKI